LVDGVGVSRSGVEAERIVLICAAGLLSGPWVGAAIGLFGGLLAAVVNSLELSGSIVGTLSAGVSTGLLNHWRPKMAAHPLTGFCLTSVISALHSSFGVAGVEDISSAPDDLVEQIGLSAVLQGSGTAFILGVVAHLRERQRQSVATRLQELQVQRRRMDQHFLFNALNTVAALAMVAPGKVPGAVGRLRDFLRAMLADDDRVLQPVSEELALIRDYLEIERLRFGERLEVEERIDESLAQALIPPFSLQPLVENAVRHGLRSSPKASRLLISVRAVEEWLEMQVSDNGPGVPAAEVERTFFNDRRPVHALTLLRQRLAGLFGHSFQLEVASAVGKGTTVMVRMPLKLGETATASSG
jgi:two-component system, LytTR family, sensor kinase